MKKSHDKLDIQDMWKANKNKTIHPERHSMIVPEIFILDITPKVDILSLSLDRKQDFFSLMTFHRFAPMQRIWHRHLFLDLFKRGKSRKKVAKTEP
ncbi:MAG: hypothetical protein HQL65_01595 [Magnetococcales bacterium]|nr:hypothetical protein [Magnetococcales bacterium]